MPEAETVHIVEMTLTERYFYDPAEVLKLWGADWEAAKTVGIEFDDFVISMFELHNGSVWGDKVFPSDASPDVNFRVYSRGADE